jgi:Reverse transcriptase (RNA-dependent DNA polymerase)
LIEELTNDQKLPHNKGLWRLSRWSRRVAGKPHADPHIPALRRHEEEALTEKDEERAKILAEKFFPPTPQVRRRRHAPETQARSPVPVEIKVTQEEMVAIIRALPTGKASGPDRIPNEILKILVEEISEGLAQEISILFAAGTLPRSLKESTTIALRKEGKKDYSLPSSYRPIALENTLAKVVEKMLTNRLSDAAEKYALLSWAQIGARKERSTLSAIGLLTLCVQTAWRAKPGCVVSMLSLDLAGAFNNVPPKRLTEILQKKGLPAWLVQVVASFTQGRRTRIAYTGYQSEWLDTATGIPQGSPLSPILFLFFISELLEKFQQPGEEIIGFGFIDDTNLITWGSTAKENCRKLTAAHQ